MSVCGAVLLPPGHSAQTDHDCQELSSVEHEFHHLDECCSWGYFYEVTLFHYLPF